MTKGPRETEGLLLSLKITNLLDAYCLPAKFHYIVRMALNQRNLDMPIVDLDEQTLCAAQDENGELTPPHSYPTKLRQHHAFPIPVRQLLLLLANQNPSAPSKFLFVLLEHG